MLVFVTRPEAIKMSPLIKEFRKLEQLLSKPKKELNERE